jgi:hypothetical protein
MSASKEVIKINENIAVNEPINTTKFNKDNTCTTNFNERTNRDYNNTLTQQQDVINMTSDNTLNNVKRSTDDYYQDIIA